MQTKDFVAAVIGFVLGIAIIGVSKGNPILFVTAGQFYLGCTVAYLFSRLTFFK